MAQAASTGVLLPEGESGSSFLHRVLAAAVERFEPELRAAELPESARVFKQTYGDAIVRFEAARIASPRRVEIARDLVESTQGSLRLREDGRTDPLREALGELAAPPAVETRALRGAPGLRAEVPFEGKLVRGADVAVLVERMHADHHLTTAARDALRWVLRRIDDEGGALDLRDQRFVLFGAAAELSPATLLLAAGATVRWVDLAPPDRTLAETPGLAGTVVHAPAGDDLLLRPRAVASSVRAFAADGPVHVGLYAYAPGASRELRIAASMDAIVRSLGADIVKSVALLVSPTSPGEMQREDVDLQEARLRSPAMWQRALAAGRALRGPARFGDVASPVCRAVMSMQGAGYQAAQCLTKIATAETLAVDGLTTRDGTPTPITVSANVAGITATRSLSHPLFKVAFEGAPAFGVRIFEPATTRALSGLLMLHDLLNPAAAGAAARRAESPLVRARALRAAQIHGGVYGVPWQFESAVQSAAVLGAARRPGLLLGLSG